MDWQDSADNLPSGFITDEQVRSVAGKPPVTGAWRDGDAPGNRKFANLGPFDPAILAGVIHNDNNDEYNVHDVQYADAEVNIPEQEVAQQMPADDGVGHDEVEHEDGNEVEHEDETSDNESDNQSNASDSDDEHDDDDGHENGLEAPIPPNNLRRSTRGTRGQTTRYDDYALMLHAMRLMRGGPRHAAVNGNFDLLNFGDVGPLSDNNRLDHITGVILTQYSVAAGLKKFGQRGEEAVTSEFSQLHSMDTMTPLDAGKLTDEQK